MMKKVLIVDDNDTNLYLLKSLLEEEGFTITAAKNGQEALDMAHADPPDLIVSDILMPVMDGYLLCRKCKSDEQLRRIPFIFYTATYTEPKDEKFALSLGADRFVLKPQEPEILVAVFKEVWATRSQAEPAAPRPLGEEMEFFRQYNEVLFRKLEKKMLDLETTNRKLKCLEEQYRLSFENVTDIVWTIDSDFNVRKISPSVERMLGYKSQDFIGRSVSDLVKLLTPESMERAMAEISLVLSGQTIPTSVYSLVARDGTIKQGEFSGSPIWREGEIVGMVSVIREITQRRLAEEKLRDSEKKYRELYDFLPIPVYEMDFEANIISANRSIYETFRGSEEDLKKGFKALQLLTPKERDKSSKNIECLLKGEKIEGTEYTLMRLDGSVFPAIVISSVIYSDGKPVGLRGAIIDITDRKRAEEELRASQERAQFLADVLNHSDQPFAVGYPDGRIGAHNPAFCRLTGYTSEELRSMDWARVLTPPEWVQAETKALAELDSTGKPVRYEKEYIRKDGSRVPIELLTHAMKNARGDTEHYYAFITDITDRKRAEEALINTTDRLKRLLAATIQAISKLVETRDPYTSGHQRRTAFLASAIATEMGFTTDRVDFLRIVSTIHDIGKIAVPAEILSRPTKLSDIEFSIIKVHPQAAYDILKDIEFPWPVAEVVLQHHERMDGSGYPKGLSGDDILLEARIVAVADVMEAMASHRPYRPALGLDVAIEEISKYRGRLYDPEVTDTCLRLFKDGKFTFT